MYCLGLGLYTDNWQSCKAAHGSEWLSAAPHELKSQASRHTFSSCCVSSAILPLLGMASLRVSLLLGTCFGGAVNSGRPVECTFAFPAVFQPRVAGTNLCRHPCATSWPVYLCAWWICLNAELTQCGTGPAAFWGTYAA